MHHRNNFLHSHRSHQRSRVHVHGHGDELDRYECSFDCDLGCGSLCGSRCPDLGKCDWCGERSVSGFVVCTCQQWWCGDHAVHGDLEPGWVPVHDRFNLVHGFESREWHRLHVQCHGNQRVRCGFVVSGFFFDCSFVGSWCSDSGCCRWCGGWSVVGVLDRACFQWWCFDFAVHGDFEPGFVHLSERDHVVHGAWSQ